MVSGYNKFIFSSSDVIAGHSIEHLDTVFAEAYVFPHKDNGRGIENLKTDVESKARALGGNAVTNFNPTRELNAKVNRPDGWGIEQKTDRNVYTVTVNVVIATKLDH